MTRNIVTLWIENLLYISYGLGRKQQQQQRKTHHLSNQIFILL